MIQAGSWFLGLPKKLRGLAKHFYQLLIVITILHLLRDQFSIAKMYAILPGKSETLCIGEFIVRS